MNDKQCSCPNCGQKIPFKNFIFLNNYSLITCKKCNSKLQIKNRVKNSLIGGIAGASTAASIVGMAYIGEHYFKRLLLGTVLGVLLALILIALTYFFAYRNTKLTIVL